MKNSGKLGLALVGKTIHFFSPALRLHSAVHAASHAKHLEDKKDGWTRGFSAGRSHPAAPHGHCGGRLAFGLWWGADWLCDIAASSASVHRRYGHTGERLGPPGELADFDRNGDKHHRYKCDPERKRGRRRRRIQRNNYVDRCVHRAGRSAFANDCPSYSHEPGRFDEIGDGPDLHHQRYHNLASAAECHHRTRRQAGVSRNGDQRGTSGLFSALEPQRGGVPRGMRERRPERQLHSAGDSSVCHNRDNHGAKRCRSLQASFGSLNHHQQFHTSSYCPTKCTCRRRCHDRRYIDLRRGLESQHGSGVVTFRSRMQ